MTVSIGGAVLRGDGGEAMLAATLHRADAALYRAKAAGRNRVLVDGLVTPVAAAPGPNLASAAGPALAAG